VAIPPLPKQKEYWEGWVTRSFEWATGPDNARRGEFISAEIAKRRQPGLRMLDVGCGSGWLSRMLAQYGEVTAIDFCAEIIQDLQVKFPDIKWVAGDFLSMELPENHYHIVTSVDVIAHVADQKAFAQRISQLIRPEGTLLLLSQNEYIYSHTSWLKPPAEGQIRNWPSRKRLRELFEPYFKVEPILTCVPGGDRGLPGMINNRGLINGFGRRLFGQEKWMRLRESWGLGCDLFLIGKRFKS
jgi:2-polyprenyl-3-methyl-5-hydroxy-6-metoxy-1,4-benzoquinol methylase